MAEVKFPDYRAYEAARIVVNDAMNALLVGSRLGVHLLTMVGQSNELLSAEFPTIEHIRRFDVRVPTARAMLSNADHHFAAVAIPYAMSAHEDFISGCLASLRAEGVPVVNGGQSLPAGAVNASNMHSALFESTGGPAAIGDLEVFHIVRLVRNCIVHRGGRISSALRSEVATLSASAVADWAGVTGEAPGDLLAHDPVRLSAGHAFMAFAVTKRLGRAANHAMQIGYPRPAWARLVVDDFAEGARQPRNSDQWRRALLGFSARQYGPIGLLDAELETAARATGAWTRNESFAHLAK